MHFEYNRPFDAAAGKFVGEKDARAGRLRPGGPQIDGILLNAASALLYLRYDSAAAAAIIDTSAAYLTILATMLSGNLIPRRIPRPVESFTSSVEESDGGGGVVVAAVLKAL